MTLHIGLDIGRRSVKLVRVDGGRRPADPPHAVRGAMRELDPVLEGDARRQATLKAVRECLVELGSPRGPCSIAVPRAEAVVKTVVLPQVPADERARLIRFQAAKDVPFELDQVVLASGVVGGSTAGGSTAGGATGAPGERATAPEEVTYAAVRTGVLEGLRSIVHEAGLVPGRLEVSTQAAARAVRLIAPEETDALLVIVGSLASDIVVFRNGRLAFTRSASVGFGRDPKETGKAEADRWLDRLVAEIQRSLRGVTGEHAPRSLLLAGIGAREEGVVGTLGARLGLPGRVLDPLGGGSSPAFLVARGLAETRPVAGIPIVDLAGIADAQAVASTRRRSLVAGGLVAGVLAVGFGVARNEVVDNELLGDKLEAELRGLKKDVDATKALQNQVLAAKNWENKKGRALEILLACSRPLPADDAYLTRLQWSEGHNVLLGGRVRDSEALDKYVRRMNRDPIVERVTPDYLRPTSEKAAEVEAKGLDFGVTAKLREEKPR